MTKTKSDVNPEKEMSLFEHVAELRRRLIVAILAVILCAIPCGLFWEPLFDAILLYPLSRSGDLPALIYTIPSEAFFLIIKISLLCGVILSMPIVLLQLWAFIAPALKKSEKLLVMPGFLSSVVLFILGVLFCYLMLPYVFSFLTSVAGEKMQPLFRAGEYLTFILKMALAFGLAFELPVISFVLTKMGLISHRILLVGLPYSVVGIFVVSAFLTPPDVVSQIVLAVPLLFLYCLSIVVAFLSRERR